MIVHVIVYTSALRVGVGQQEQSKGNGERAMMTLFFNANYVVTEPFMSTISVVLRALPNSARPLLALVNSVSSSRSTVLPARARPSAVCSGTRSKQTLLFVGLQPI